MAGGEEFMQAWDPKILCDIAALANSEGGTIYVGISGDGGAAETPSFRFTGFEFTVTLFDSNFGGGGDAFGGAALTGAQSASLAGMGAGEHSMEDLMRIASAENRESFRRRVLKPLIDSGCVEMTIADKPRSMLQRYRATEKGRSLE
ncbi:MAG: ATP-binding protein [Candidatus Methanoplasma sp.]|nr:ATP-binding protein [Candidatus Methanoplasma sp.]